MTRCVCYQLLESYQLGNIKNKANNIKNKANNIKQKECWFTRMDGTKKIMHSPKGQYAAIGECKWNKIYEQLPHPSKHFNGQPVEGLCLTFFWKTITTSSDLGPKSGARLENWDGKFIEKYKNVLNRRVAFPISANLPRVDNLVCQIVVGLH